MDGIHLLGEWYGCPADMPEMTRAEPLRALCLRLAEASGMTVVGERFPIRAAGRHGYGAARGIAPCDPHLARTRLRDHRRLRLQLHDRQHRKSGAAVPRACRTR